MKRHDVVAELSVCVQGHGSGKPATMAEVEELLKEGKRLGLQLRGLPRLISMMAQARSFNMRARRALKRGAFYNLPDHPCIHQAPYLSIPEHACLPSTPPAFRERHPSP